MARTIDRAPPSGPDSPGLEARVAKLEAAVEHIERDVGDIKAALGRLATVVDRMDGFLQAMLPTLVTKAELANLKADLEGKIAGVRTDLSAEIAKRPTTATVIMVVAALIAIAGLPYWGHWLTGLKAMLGAHP